MSRRTLLAFVLIFLVLVGQAVLQDKLNPRKQAAGDADSTAVAVTGDVATTAAPATGEASAGETAAQRPSDAETEMMDSGANPDPIAVSGPTTIDQALQIAPGAVEMDVVVATPLYEITISSLGGQLTSWLGLDHPHHEGGPVELIPEARPTYGQDALVFRHGEMDLGSAIFTIDGPSRIDLNPGDQPRSVTLRAVTAGGLEVRKIFTFDAETYGITIDYELGTADETLARKSLELLGTPEVFRFSWNQGISLTERVQRMELPSLRSVAKIGDDFHKKKRNDLKKSVDKVTGEYRGSIAYAAVQNRYFAICGIVPLGEGGAVEGSIRLGGDQPTMAQSWEMDLPALRPRGLSTDLATSRLEMYIGPQQTELLAAYGRNVEESVDLGFRWIRPVSQAVLWLMEIMYKVIPNYGVIIIIISILLKLVFYPLTKTQTESMKKMQEIQPKLKALQEKYKKDKEKLNQATMELYRQEKVNPLGGCMPLLVQMPIFIALYQAFSHTISLRGQPFMLWMSDLSQPDALFTLPFTIPFMGSDFNVLPILMGGAMWFQTKMTPTPAAGGQMAMMNTLMPVIMLFFFYNMPSGLVLYWLVNTILQGYQSWKIQKAAPSTGGSETK